MADRGTRFAQHLIDFFVFLALFITYVFLMEDAFGVHQPGDYVRPMGGLALYLLYYAGSEILFARTPGKYFMRTKVVDGQGRKPTALWLLLRNICRFVPLDEFTYLFDKRGWHDQLSRTYVIRDSATTTLH